MAELPNDIREMAKLIAALCDKYLPEQKWPLVGGLVLLRLYCPTIIAPSTYGLFPTDHPIPPNFRKNLMQVTRLLQNASNHQPFKDGPNLMLNEWIEAHASDIDAFLDRVINSQSKEPAEEKDDSGAARTFDAARVLKLVQLCVQNKNKMVAVFETWDEESKPSVSKYEELLSSCGNPFRTRTGTVAKATEALSLSNVPQLRGPRHSLQEEDPFFAMLRQHAAPSQYLDDYFNNGPTKEKTVFLCSLISNDKHGVTCMPKIGKTENHLVFPGKGGVDWIIKYLKITDRSKCCSLCQDILNLSLMQPWQLEKKEKKGGAKFEDTDRLYWFDYAAISTQKKLTTSSNGLTTEALKVKATAEISSSASSSGRTTPATRNTPPASVSSSAHSLPTDFSAFMKSTPPSGVSISAPNIPPVTKNAGPPTTMSSEEEMTALLAPYKVQTLQRIGLMEKSTALTQSSSPRDEVSSKEQWRILLIIVWCMGDRGFGVAEGGDPNEVKFSEAVVFDWMEKYLDFQSLAQVRELLQTLLNDGFIVESEAVSERKMYGFAWSKIQAWYEKTFAGRTPRGLSTSTSVIEKEPVAPGRTATPPIPPKLASLPPKAKKGRIPGVSTMRASGFEVDEWDRKSDGVTPASPTSPSKRSETFNRERSSRTSLTGSLRASRSDSGTFKKASQEAKKGEDKKVAAEPKAETKAETKEEKRASGILKKGLINDKNRSKSGGDVNENRMSVALQISDEEDEPEDVSMMDFLAMDPGDVKKQEKEGDKTEPPRPPKGASFKSLFSKDKKNETTAAKLGTPPLTKSSSRAGGLFGRKKGDD